MPIPRLTAEAGLGPALHSYAAGPSARTGNAELVPMGFLDTIGDFFSGVLDKVPCLLSCGIPNAITIAAQCGTNPGCWLTKAPPAGLECIRQCLH